MLESPPIGIVYLKILHTRQALTPTLLTLRILSLVQKSKHTPLTNCLVSITLVPLFPFLKYLRTIGGLTILPD